MIKIVNSLEELVVILKNELALKPGDTIRTATPQFKRQYELTINWKPESVDEFNVVCNDLPIDILNKMGICLFGKTKGSKLYLFPGEWFDLIPKGYPVVDIFGHEKLWNKETADNDIRYGCLSCGFLRD
jgi:hypothetical protein